MKPKLLLLFIAVSSAVTLKAQTEFAPIGATWYYSNMESMRGDEGYIKVVSTDTTTINGRNVKELVPFLYGSSGRVTELEHYYVWQTGDSVLYYFDGEFRLIYNFGLSVGEKADIYNPGNKYCESPISTIIIDSINTLEVNGHTLKRFYSKVDDDMGTSYGSPFAEKIGAMWGIFNGTCYSDAVGDGLGTLRCYEDSVIGFFHYSIKDCDYTNQFDWEAYYEWERQQIEKLTGVDDVCAESGFSVIYSSANRTITICLQDDCKLNHIVIVNSNGRIVYNDICQSEANINVPLLKNGLYIIQAKNENGTYYEKIIAY